MCLRVKAKLISTSLEGGYLCEGKPGNNQGAKGKNSRQKYRRAKKKNNVEKEKKKGRL